MKILAVNGSHRPGKNTALMLQIALEEARNLGCETELLELKEFSIHLCKACNKCLKNNQCSIQDDDFKLIAGKMLESDGIILGSPVYFQDVTSLIKIFMDRTRWMHMTDNMLKGKVAGAVVNAGLRNGGQESTLQALERFLLAHGLLVVGSRPPGRLLTQANALGTIFYGADGEDIRWNKSVLEDPLVPVSCQQLARNMVELIHRLNKK